MLTAKLTGKSLRLARLSRPGDGRYLIIPLDHSVSDGPIGAAAGFARLVENLVSGGADGLVVHKGRARMIPADLLSDCGLVIHLSASTAHARDTNAKVLVGEVDEAVRLGADAVSVHVNVGSDTEAEQLRDLGTIASACDRWGMPLLAMIYPRGPRVDDPSGPALVAHAVNIAADLGADLVKTTMAVPAARMAEVIDSSPLPVLVAGGPASDRLPAMAVSAMAVGCSGLAVGRGVFTSATPRRVVAELSGIVHGPAFSPDLALESGLAGAQ